MFKKIICTLLLFFPIFVFASNNANQTSTRTVISAPTTTITDKKNAFEIQLSIPLITGDKEKSSLQFNDAIKKLVDNTVAQFKKNIPTPEQVTEIQTRLNTKAKSQLIITTEVIFNENGILSLRMKNFVYILGAAHPSTTYQTFTYDLNQNKPIQLGDLFRSDANYLQVISKYCNDEIVKRNISNENWIGEGTEPSSQNYRNWNITAKGIQITFDTYQVAAYVYGPQEVIIPYSSLEKELRPNSPISFIVNPDW